MPVLRGCGSWECGCGEKHTIPVEVEGKSGSSRVRLMPAPKGVGLCVSNEAKKVMRLAGIKDMWTKRQGESKTRNNYIIAIFDAFKRMNMMRLESRAPAKEQEEKYEEVEEADTEQVFENDNRCKDARRSRNKARCKGHVQHAWHEEALLFQAFGEHAVEYGNGKKDQQLRSMGRGNR